jgi:hypothetical protein
MEREFRQGHIEIDFASEPFDSPMRLVVRALRMFVRRFAIIAAITLAVFIPGSLALQGICEALDVPINGIPFYLVMQVLDIMMASFVAPAVVYALVGSQSGFDTALRWGRRQFGKTLWNEIKVNVIVTLRLLLLVVPGVMAMLRFIFTDIVVAIEGDLAPDPMARSTELSRGRRWRLFAALAPIAIVNMGAEFLILDRPGIVESRVLFALADSALNIFGQLTTVAVLLIYLGLVPPKRPAKAKRAA